MSATWKMWRNRGRSTTSVVHHAVVCVASVTSRAGKRVACWPREIWSAVPETFQLYCKIQGLLIVCFLGATLFIGAVEKFVEHREEFVEQQKGKLK